MPFTIDQFLDVFRRYNTAVWPAQWGLLSLAIAAVILALRGRPHTERWVSAVLAVLWLWMAVAYHRFRRTTSARLTRSGSIRLAAATRPDRRLARVQR